MRDMTDAASRLPDRVVTEAARRLHAWNVELGEERPRMALHWVTGPDGLADSDPYERLVRQVLHLIAEQAADSDPATA